MRKKAISILMISLLLFGTLILALSNLMLVNSQSIGSETLIDDDFESYPSGSFPSGYTMVYNGAGDDYQKITNAYSYSGSQSFTLKGQDSWSVVVEKKISVTSDVVSIRGMLMSETPKHSINSYGKINNNIAIGFWNASASTWGEYYGNIDFGDDGIIKLGGGESVINLTTYKPYTWYNVKLVLSISQNTVDAYINNTWMARTALKNDASKMNAVFLGNAWSGVVGYIDDIKVSEGKPISLIDDDFESYPSGSFPSGYTMVYNGAGDTYQKITNAYSHSGTQSFTLKGADHWSVVVQKKFNRAGNILKLTGWLMSNGNTAGNVGIGFWNATADTWGEYYGYIGFGGDGMIQLGGGETAIDLVHYQPYVWYKVGVEIDIQENVAKAFINDTFMAQTSLIHNSSKINAVYMGNGWSDIVGYVDDIQLSEGEPISTTIPSAPKNLQATADDSQISLTWSVPSDDGGSAITGYRIYRGTSSGNEVYLRTVTNTAYDDTIVSNDQPYYYQVSAVNSVGESQMSNEVTARPFSSVDSDNDGLPDSWEMEYFGTLSHAANSDDDNDGYTNLEEYNAGTDPTSKTSNPGALSNSNNSSWDISFFVLLLLVAIGLLVGLIAVKKRKHHGKSSELEEAAIHSIPQPRIKKEQVDQIYDLENGSHVYGFGDFFSYRIGKNIGFGGFSEVYLVEKNGRKYAMKVPKSVDLRGGETMLLKTEDIESYAKEAKIWAMLTEKVPDSVVDLIDAGIRPFPWFVMELADHSLKDKMHAISLQAKLRFATTILTKLDKIHKIAVVHKDIKPENILYANGQWKFTDFGLSKIIDKSSKSTMLSGTPWYMAPEQVSPGGEYGHSDVRTDVWGMGVVLYEMLTGVSPFKGERYEQVGMAILFQEPKKPSEINPEIPKEIDEIIMKALAKKKEDRWQSAMEFKRALEEVKI